MAGALYLAKTSCRSTLWKTLLSRSPVLKLNTVQRESCKISRMPAALFCTTNTVQAQTAAHDHSHTKIWTAERFLSGSLVGILPLSLAFPTPALDYALALALTLHVHWGVEAIVVDYARPSVVGTAVSKGALAAVYGLSVLTLGGLFYFNYADVGLSQAIRMLWKL
ncbi:hypothetical protein JTE90_004644 [Oedothorax gibbosus]|uniref:Succinate dehydrogenase [ubiquinone] cytochrome b small subunit n=1 Tax=Oedothorax gibbosus TaxID=931172 RepID=A0AAV6UZ55_9ARAC|nr:hypothetical protein JTE90_004644 [Oedothorax gibbosus]